MSSLEHCFFFFILIVARYVLRTVAIPQPYDFKLISTQWISSIKDAKMHSTYLPNVEKKLPYKQKNPKETADCG